MTNYFVHESSYVDEGCQIGAGTKIWHFSHIMSGCTIGEDCNIGQNVVISPNARVPYIHRKKSTAKSGMTPLLRQKIRWRSM